MKNVFKFLLPLFALFALSSCEDVIQVKLDEGSKLYVVDAFVNDLREPQVIRVLTNSAYFTNSDAPPVTDAVVVLTDLTNNQQYTFNYGSQGNYIYNVAAGDTLARVGHRYRLDVTIDGVVYTAQTTQKRGASIDSIATEKIEDNGFGGPTGNYVCTLWAKDKVDNDPDYYWIKTFRNDTLFTAAGDINLCIDGTGGAVTGLEGVDSTDFTPPATFLGFNTFQPGSRCRVQVHSLDRGTYYFLVQAVQQINNGGLFATTPENVKTNLVTPKEAKTKAVGWFNMATVATGSVQVPN